MNATRIILLFVLLDCLIIGGSVLTYGFSTAALQNSAHLSGSLCLLLFSAIFLLYNKPHIIHLWLSEKYHMLFAIVSAIHLGVYVALLPSLPGKLVPYRIAGGTLAYIMIFAMPFIRNQTRKGLVEPRRFFIVETVFLYYIWLVFFMTYLPRVQGKLPGTGETYAENVAWLGWVSTLLGIKLTSLIRFRSTR